MAPRRLQMRRL